MNPADAAIAAFNEAIASVEEWIRISPYREIPNEVGLQVFDRTGAEAMLASFNSLAGRIQGFFRGLPIFVGHPDDPKWRKEYPMARNEAMGRIKELQVRDDGLYGRTAFNAAGKLLVSGNAPAYAFQSPRWGMVPIIYKGRKAFRPVELYSIGLTNNPNIPENAIGLNEAGSRKAETTASTARITAIDQAVTKYQKAHGDCDRTTGYLAVRKAQPALFAVRT
jgi:hypothetical protein